MQEEAERNGDLVRFTAPARLGHSVRPRGYDFAVGRTILERGVLLGAFQVAVAAAANAGTVAVSRRPRIALLATGDELVLPCWGRIRSWRPTVLGWRRRWRLLPRR
jgi:molybdopterin molybdotransferase